MVAAARVLRLLLLLRASRAASRQPIAPAPKTW